MNVTFLAEDEGTRLDRALAARMPEHSRSFLARLIDEGRVMLDGRPAPRPSIRVAEGQNAAIDIPEPVPTSAESQEIPLSILFEDSDLVVINKPAGLVVHPAAGHADRTLVNALLFHVHDLSGIGGELRPGIVHRLDKDTSGVMVIAKNDATHRELTAAWSTDAVRKEYVAIVYGTPSQMRGTIDAPIARDPRNRKRMAIVAGGRNAITDYEVIEQLRYASVIRCSLRTGRTHQIRVHLKSLGHPIIGDPVYSGPQWRGIPDKKLQKAIAGLGRQALHAAHLAISHPKTDKRMSFAAPLPDDMRDLILALR
ncbi:MAG TPA: RluA family pseudouridine synthase [Thermoanaerobaculia bacterium]|jgi:23S rRNA pseudouridine1911/1915/1917 synthase|nr:RluA family pseudouridine synthase [Thermoanaerobaculia bacterium]